MWVARDKNNIISTGLWLFAKKPIRNKVREGYWGTEGSTECMELDSSLYPELKWDDEPIEVCLAEKSKHHICYMKEVSGEVTAITERLFLELLYKGYPIIKQTEKSTIIQNYFNYVDSKR